MDFNGQYLKYEEYKLLGGSLDLPSFNLLEFNSRKEIDLRTQNRLIYVDDIPQEVKICVYDLIERLNRYSKTINSSNGNVASFSSDGYSESFITASQIKDIISSKHAELNDLIKSSLNSVVVNDENVIFRGVR